MAQKVPASMLADSFLTGAALDAAIAAEVVARNAAISAAAVKLPGDAVQSVRFATGAMSTGTTVVQSVNPPAITEGTEVMALSFTPTSATNLLRIRVVTHASCSVSSALGAASLHAGGASLATGGTAAAAAADLRQIVIEHQMVAGVTTAIPFTVRQGFTSAGTMTFNGTAGTVRFGGALASHITIDEIKV